MDYSPTIHALFEEEVRKNPRKNALSLNKQVLSYSQLNQRANQVAHYLRLLGIKPDMPVVVCMERSFEFFIAVLGILKAGGAYIPLDYTHPEERLLFIIKESNASVVLTTSNLQKQFKRFDGIVLQVDDHNITQQSSDNPTPCATAANLAYVIYTSGSTGTPKGVLIEHKGIVNYAFWFAKECINHAEEKIDCSSNTAFDFALTLTVVPLALGLSVVICDDMIKKDPRRYIEYLQSNAVSLIKITPSYFKVLYYELQNKKNSFPCLKKIMLAGENLSTIDCLHWLEHYPEHLLYNEYGPTETSVAVTLFIVDRYNVHQLGETVPIGFLLPNASYHILNEALAPVAEGETGELYLGGRCVARGYLGNPLLTERYFIADPFSEDGKETLYKTGDLCRRLPQGEIECIGRIDHQLKIRGFRIELEEIEHCLGAHPAIKTAVVIASDKYVKEKRLLAYYLVHEGQIPPDEQELRTYLKRFLPDYMIPVLFIRLEQLPLNANEKLDRTALPVPQGSMNPYYKAPKKLLEKKLAAIWSDELGTDWVGLTDNFFELGGHSLSAARVISKINYQFNKEINLQSFYQDPTLEALIPIIKKAKKIKQPRIKLNELHKNTLPLSDFQLMLWLADTFEPKAKKLNIFARTRLQGQLDLKNLNKAFAALLQKHKILSYRISKFHPNHYLQKHQGFAIVEQNLALLPAQEGEMIIETSAQQLRNYYPWPKNKPQIIARLFYLKNGTSELQITMPHLIADDLCPNILLQDLSLFYVKPRSRRVKEKNVYQHYILQEQHYFKTHLQDDTKFWDNYLKEAHLFSFPASCIIPNMAEQKLAYSTYAKLSEELIANFKNYCAQHHISILDGLCAVLLLALKNCSLTHELTSSPICINRVKSTRDNQDYDHSLGCFLRLEPLKLKVNKAATLSSLAHEIHAEVMHTAPFQRCSNLIKLASIATFRQQYSLIKQYSLKTAVWLYTTFTGWNINRSILNMTGRLNSDKGNHFLINVNVQNNFIASSDKKEQEYLFDLAVQPIAEQQSDLLAIDNLLDVCFMRMNNNMPFLVLSANLEPQLKERIIKEMIKLMKAKKEEFQASVSQGKSLLSENS